MIWIIEVWVLFGVGVGVCLVRARVRRGIVLVAPDMVSLWQENGILARGDGGTGDRARFLGEGELMRGWVLLFVMLVLVGDVAYQVTTPVTRATQFRSLALQHRLKGGWSPQMSLWIAVTRLHQPCAWVVTVEKLLPHFTRALHEKKKTPLNSSFSAEVSTRG